MNRISISTVLLTMYLFAHPLVAQELQQLPAPQTFFSNPLSFEFQGDQIPSHVDTTSTRNPLTPDDRERLSLSISADDYPVTPGDVYKLTYLTADTAISFDFVVDG